MFDNGKNFQQLSAQDAAFLYMESEDNLTHVLGFTIYDPSTAPGGKVRFKDIIQHVESRLHTSPLFTRRLVRVPLELDYPYWEDDPHFDIEFHMRHGRLPEPGDWRQFCIHMARYHSQPLSMGRPPWEMYVVEGLDNIDGLPRGSYAIATKIHHVAVDGASAVKFFAALADRDAKGTPSIDISQMAVTPSHAPTLFDMGSRALVNNIRSPVRMADALFRAAPTMFKAVQSSFGSSRKSKQEVPETRFNQPVSPHKMFSGTDFQLADFKRIKDAIPGATINDVVLTICAGGLRHYLQSHKELPEEPLVAWVPVNARPKGTSADAPGNNITAMTAAIHTHIEDPLKRLQAVADTTRQTKEAKSGLSARLMTDLSQHVPAATQALAGRLVLRVGTGPRVCNLFVSNVPGPQVPQYMNGALAVKNYALAPLNNGMGLFIATPSYNGVMTFGVTSTREILPDIEFFVECLRKGFNDLMLASGAAKPKRKRVKKTTKKRTKKTATKPKPRARGRQ